MIRFQGCGTQSKEYEEFKEELFKIMTPPKNASPNCVVDHRSKNTPWTRVWDTWAIMNNGVFKKTDDVLEFGAWPTFTGLYFAKHVKHITLTDNFQWIREREEIKGYSPEEWIEEINKYNVSNITARELDIQTTDYPNKTFDKIISISALEHVPDDKLALEEMARILKDDGVVIMTVDFKYGKPVCFKEYSRIYTKETLERLIDESPFEFIGSPFEPWWKGDLPNHHKYIFSICLALKKKW